MAARCVPFGGVAPLADGAAGQSQYPTRGGGELYVGMQPSPPMNGYWSFGEAVYWVLDDGTMGPAGASAHGGRVAEYEFLFGLHADFPGTVIQPYVVVSFYNAPAAPITGAGDPVVQPPAPVSSIAWLFSPITLPAAGDFAFRSGLIDLETAGALPFDLDDTYYVEVLPMEWNGIGGFPVFDPDVHAAFTGPDALSLGLNEDRFWSDVFIVNPTFALSDGDGFYDHPAEMDTGGSAPFLDRGGLILRGQPCSGAATLRLELLDPADACVQPGELIEVELRMSCLSERVRGVQAFLAFSPSQLTFVSGAYSIPGAFDLPIIDPISAAGDAIDVASGIDDASGQLPTESGAAIAVLTFAAGSVDGPTQVAFRPHSPPTRFSDVLGGPVDPTLFDSPLVTIDGTPPVLTCPPDATISCDAASDPAHTGAATATDNLDPSPLLSFTDSVVPGACPDSYVIVRTWNASDCAGNTSACDQHIVVADDAAPFVVCPLDMEANADAGSCAAVLDVGEFIVADNCDASPAVSFSRSDGKPDLADPFDSADSPIVITWSAEDACGNRVSCFQTIVVHAVNELVVDVELQAIHAPLLTRCITYDLLDCVGPPATVSEPLTFEFGRLPAPATISVPCGAYQHIRARDRLHTLARVDSDDFAIVGPRYMADFTDRTGVGGDNDALLGGDLNDDGTIDLSDLAMFLPPFGLTLSANTSCTTTGPHQDINGDGFVATADFTFIHVNFGQNDDPNGCP